MAPDTGHKSKRDSTSFKRKRDSTEDDPKQPKEAKKIPPVPAKISRVEEPAFPRGGASVLTPLEHKQIQIEATRDVLFEQENAKSSKSVKGDEDGDPRPNKKSKSKKKLKKAVEGAEPEEDVVKIEGLSYKRIVPGSLILGQVSQINKHDIAVSLPNNLTGYVPITSISSKLTKRIEELAAVESSDNEEEASADDELDLGKIFSIGQYVRTYVVSTSDDSETLAGAKKTRIELSIKPQQSNSALKPDSVIVNNTIMASVASVEDHGVIMDLEIEGSDMKGFMSSKEIGQTRQLVDMQEGAVILCLVTGLSSNGKTVKLSVDTEKIGALKKGNYLSTAPNVDSFVPGSAVEVLVTDITTRGLAGKLMGMIDVTADLIHSGAGTSGKELEKKYKIGSKIKGRVICTFPTANSPKIGISLLDHVVSLSTQATTRESEKEGPLTSLPLSAIVEQATVRKVEDGVGLFMDVGVKGVPGFVHISRIKDGKVDTVSTSTGPYKVGSTHRSRVIGYNSIDGIFLLSLEESILNQPFLRIEDVKVGEVVKGTVEKIVVNAKGVSGLVLNLAAGISGLVPEIHMADVHLLHPEKKFKEGSVVTARVLSVNPERRRIRLTLKKTLVNSEASPFLSYEDVATGSQSPGTIINLLQTGAVVQFYGAVRGFLPVAEMSEAFIDDPKQHFKIGQVVNVHVLRVDPTEHKLIVSCKDPSVFGLAQQAALKNLEVGEVVSATVTEKSSDDISVEIQELGLRAVLPVGHLTDGSDSKNATLFKRIRVGQNLPGLVVLEKREQKRVIILSSKPSLVIDAKNKLLIRSFEDVKEDKIVHGFIKNITLTAVFVQFAGGIVALLPKSKLTTEARQIPDFGLKRFQSITVKIVSVDKEREKFVLGMPDADSKSTNSKEQGTTSSAGNPAAINAVDDTITSVNDFTRGKVTRARIISVKDTQINVQLADNIQGRIDVSQVFDSWEDIKDRKRPLRSFSYKQILSVKVLGIHDARNHRFLPISHRSGRNLVFELSAKPSDQVPDAEEPLTFDKIKVGSSWIAYVNNSGDDCLWVNLSPNVRGRVRTLDVCDDVSLLKDLDSNFPTGSALKVRVTNIDAANKRLDLSGRSLKSKEALTFKSLSKGMIVPGKVTKISERSIMVQLSDNVSGPVNLTDMADDFSEADPTKFSKNDIIRVCIVDLDAPNKKVRLSTRPSRVLNSSIKVEDAEILSAAQLKVNDVVRGFVKNVTDKGIFVQLGGNVTAYVRVSNLSDSFIKDWKSAFEIDQLVKGKITSVQADASQVQMSLKASVIDKDYVAPLTFEDLEVGQVITGKIRKVEDFGVFIVIDGSKNVSGLCHSSEMAEKQVQDVRKLYEEGDNVKAIVLKKDLEKRRISFGLKASYFEDVPGSEGESEDDEDGDSMQGVQLDVDSDEDEEEDGGIDLDDVESVDSDLGAVEDSDLEMEDAEDSTVPALHVSGFDWNAAGLDEDLPGEGSEDEASNEKPKKKKRKAEIQVDKTGDLDANGPQSVDDFERLLLGQPDSSTLWIQYMAFQMQLSELGKARDVAERAIRTINMREETEKLNVWVALLNLENTYGTEETTEEVFKRACQYNDAQEIHERMTSIYILSSKREKADELFLVLVKKFSQSPAVWFNYAQFLMTTLSAPDRARTLLSRATQSLPPHNHIGLTLKFAGLEFHSPNGSPERGRTIFEGLISTFPKRLDIWNQLLDLELQQGDKDIIRGVFERVTKAKALKAKGAKSWFKRWSEWEEKNGDKKSQEKVKARAEEWVRAAVNKKGEQDHDE